MHDGLLKLADNSRCLFDAGTWHAILAQAQLWKGSGRSAEFHSIPRWVDSGGQSAFWAGI